MVKIRWPEFFSSLLGKIAGAIFLAFCVYIGFGPGEWVKLIMPDNISSGILLVLRGAFLAIGVLVMGAWFIGHRTSKNKSHPNLPQHLPELLSEFELLLKGRNEASDAIESGGPTEYWDSVLEDSRREERRLTELLKSRIWSKLNDDGRLLCGKLKSTSLEGKGNLLRTLIQAPGQYFKSP